MAARRCVTGHWWSRCGQAGSGSCQFCGRVFCAQHGCHYASGEEICARDICERKRVDLTEQETWREQAIARSNRGFCAMPECLERRAGQCSHCHALFCEDHLHERLARVREGSLAFSQPVSLCDHCAARNKLWAKR